MGLLELKVHHLCGQVSRNENDKLFRQKMHIACQVLLEPLTVAESRFSCRFTDTCTTTQNLGVC